MKRRYRIKADGNKGEKVQREEADRRPQTEEWFKGVKGKRETGDDRRLKMESGLRTRDS
jgi:hypothetical protein